MIKDFCQEYDLAKMENFFDESINSQLFINGIVGRLQLWNICSMEMSIPKNGFTKETDCIIKLEISNKKASKESILYYLRSFVYFLKCQEGLEFRNTIDEKCLGFFIKHNNIHAKYDNYYINPRRASWEDSKILTPHNPFFNSLSGQASFKKALDVQRALDGNNNFPLKKLREEPASWIDWLYGYLIAKDKPKFHKSTIQANILALSNMKALENKAIKDIIEEKIIRAEEWLETFHAE